MLAKRSGAFCSAALFFVCQNALGKLFFVWFGGEWQGAKFPTVCTYGAVHFLICNGIYAQSVFAVLESGFFFGAFLAVFGAKLFCVFSARRRFWV